MKLKTIEQRAKFAATCQRLGTNTMSCPGWTPRDYFVLGFIKGVASSQRNRARTDRAFQGVAPKR